MEPSVKCSRLAGCHSLWCETHSDSKSPRLNIAATTPRRDTRVGVNPIISEVYHRAPPLLLFHRTCLRILCLEALSVVLPLPRVMQGKCDLPVSRIALLARELLSDVPLLPLGINQCLLIHNDNLIDLSAASVWIDNVYLRVGPNATFPTAINMNPSSQTRLNEPSGARLWLTSATIQSNGGSHSIGVDVQSNSQAYLQGEDFTGSMCA